MSEETIDKPSHFCMSASCSFGKTTMLPAAGVFVSSVGEYRPGGGAEDDAIAEIGCGRFYETFVFKWTTGARCAIQGCICGGVPNADDLREIDSLCANTREEAEANHWKLVEKYRGAKQ